MVSISDERAAFMCQELGGFLACPTFKCVCAPIAACQCNTVVTAVRSSSASIAISLSPTALGSRNSFASQQHLAQSPASDQAYSQDVARLNEPPASCRAAHELRADPVDCFHGAFRCALPQQHRYTRCSSGCMSANSMMHRCGRVSQSSPTRRRRSSSSSPAAWSPRSSAATCSFSGTET